MNRAFLRHLLLAALIVAAPAPKASRAENQITVDCPDYVVHLQSARTKLERGNRPAADVELQQATTALRVCLRDQASETALAAAKPTNESVCD